MTVRERSKIFKALGHPARLAVVERLAEGECCVCELLEGSEFSKLSGATVSQHLLVLKTAGIIADERRGKQIFYQLLIPCVANLTLCLEKKHGTTRISTPCSAAVTKRSAPKSSSVAGIHLRKKTKP